MLSTFDAPQNFIGYFFSFCLRIRHAAKLKIPINTTKAIKPVAIPLSKMSNIFSPFYVFLL
jgi:hypothetical protein